MRGTAVRVPRSRGEETRQALRALGILRPGLAVRREREALFFPVLDGSSVPPELGEVVECEFEEVPAPPVQDYRELLAWPREQAELLPRSFDVVGDIVLVRILPEVEHRGPEIGEALLRFVPGARLVGQDHGVAGPERRRQLERLAGAGTWRTRHRENGLELDVDLERAYFSPRLAREHARVAAEVRPGERVYDLCCGVGPFALTIARDGRAVRVVAVDANPSAVELLRSTLGRYSFGANVEVVEDRVERFALAHEPHERVVFNLPREGIKYLPSVGNLVSRAGRLVHYDMSERDGRPERVEELVRELGGRGAWRLVGSRTVHPYSPTADLVAHTFERLAA
jgi:tRNA (guanine37-N1)-methyltransferase